ncbi:MAG TPA: CPBP family intramembrane metalloprotease [Firmicutes bacterium]|nr:CPBP family intramembrane metalloprotease [Bacillota bacterium]
MATLGFVVVLYVTWIGAWLLIGLLEDLVGWPATADDRTFYWTVWRIILWMVPAALVMRYSGIGILEALKGKGLRSILSWGGGVGLLIGMEVCIRLWMGEPPDVPVLNWQLVSTVIMAPLAEEFAFRGAVLGGLLKKYSFGIANALSSLFFVGAHMPGWYFSGTLVENVTKPVGGALSIFILGLIFGFVVFKSRSVASGMIAHAINNFVSVL